MRHIWMFCALVVFFGTTDAWAATRTSTRGSSLKTPSANSAVAAAAGTMLVGNQEVQGYGDSNPAGMAQAFEYTRVRRGLRRTSMCM